MKITQSEIANPIERSNQWTRHREAMQIMGAALRAHNEGRRLGHSLTAEQIELVTMGCGGPVQSSPTAPPRARKSVKNLSSVGDAAR